MKSTLKILAVGCAAAALAVPAAASAAKLPPPPVTADGKQSTVFATGVAVPTQITFGAGKTFIAGGAEGPKVPGGLYVVKKNSKKAVPIKHSPASAYGVVWNGGKLYASQQTRIVVYSGWNGKGFNKRKTLAKGPKGFSGFSGLAIGPDNRVYAGVSLTQEFDHTANPMKYANTVISVKKSGGGLKTVSRGLRQPWQMTFAKGETSPIVSVLAQDQPKGVDAPDLLVKATPGSNFGFPECNWATGSPCSGLADPLHLFPKPENGPASSPMGIASRGNRLYLALFGGLPGSMSGIVTLNKSGDGVKPFMTGFGPPMLSVALHKGYVYAGDFTGRIYRVKE